MTMTSLTHTAVSEYLCHCRYCRQTTFRFSADTFSLYFILRCKLVSNMAEEVKPYSFEPRKKLVAAAAASSSNSNEIDESLPREERAGNTDWCRCGECESMCSSEESVCCQESEIISNIRGDLECITQHDSFKSVVLNIDTLSTARYHILMHCKNQPRTDLQTPSNRMWRHIAYRQFVYWMNSWTKLGKKRRKILPSCVIAAIRLEYPNPVGQKYLGFVEAEGVAPEYFD